MRRTGNRSRLPLAFLIFVQMPVMAQMLPPPLCESTSEVRWSSYVQVRNTGIRGGDDVCALRRFKGGDLTPSVQWCAQGLFKDTIAPRMGRRTFRKRG